MQSAVVTDHTGPRIDFGITAEKALPDQFIDPVSPEVIVAALPKAGIREHLGPTCVLNINPFAIGDSNGHGVESTFDALNGVEPKRPDGITKLNLDPFHETEPVAAVVISALESLNELELENAVQLISTAGDAYFSPET